MTTRTIGAPLDLGCGAGHRRCMAFADNNPVDEKWWPTEFGPDDGAGGTNYHAPTYRCR